MEKNENGYSEYRFGRSGSNGNGGSMPNGGEMNGVQGGDGTNDGCNGSFGTQKRQLAMVYSPYQCWRMLYSPMDALAHGTLFEELYKPLEECNDGK